MSFDDVTSACIMSSPTHPKWSSLMRCVFGHCMGRTAPCLMTAPEITKHIVSASEPSAAMGSSAM